MPIKSGHRYHVINVETGTALDLSGTDPEHSSIIGWAPHGNENQQWKFDEVGKNLYKIKNVRYHDKYVGYAEPLQPGTNAIGTESAIDWEVLEDARPETYSITVPGEGLVLSLRGSKDGTPVELSFNQNQRWEIRPVHLL